MTRDERQRDLHARATRGDAEAHAELMADLDGLAWAAAHRHAYRLDPGGDVEDLAQEARLGVLVAIADWDPGPGVPIAAYARQRAEGAVRHYVRDRGSAVRVPAAAQDRGERPPAIVDLDDETHAAAGDPTAAALRRLIVREALDALPDELREAVEAIHVSGWTGPAAARALGVPVGTLRNRARRGVERLRESLAG